MARPNTKEVFASFRLSGIMITSRSFADGGGLAAQREFPTHDND